MQEHVPKSRPQFSEVYPHSVKNLRKGNLKTPSGHQGCQNYFCLQTQLISSIKWCKYCSNIFEDWFSL